ncbi:hypothetical protein M9Y10_024339 [Tritrichomonas musculus]|uniref:Uncharacterized protein n=1 Tax=Tritrichomonas musculus TaxID=1915356 RepID=A0ABR2HDI1_9EUKA
MLKKKVHHPGELDETSTGPWDETIITYKLDDKHVDTFTDLITQLNTSNDNLKKWLTKLESTKTIGIDFIQLDNISVIEEKTDEETKTTSYEVKQKPPKSLNNTISNISLNNNNISKLEPIKVVEKETNTTTNETIYDIKSKKINTFKEFVEQANTTNDNINKLLNQLNSDTIIYTYLLEAFGTTPYICIINETTNEPEIRPVKIEIVEESPEPDNTQGPEPNPPPADDQIQIIGDGSDTFYFPSGDELSEAFEKIKSTIKSRIKPKELVHVIVKKIITLGKQPSAILQKLLVNIIGTMVAKNVVPFILSYHVIDYALTNTLKIIYNVVYFLWNSGIPYLLFKEYNGTKEVIVMIINYEKNKGDYIGKIDHNIDELVDRFSELLPSRETVDALKSKGYEIYEVAYTSFPIFWSNVWSKMKTIFTTIW